MLLDIGAPETFITSTRCLSSLTTQKYDPSLSLTSEQNTTGVSIDNDYIYVYGNIAQDTFDIGGRQIHHQPFVQAAYAYGDTLSDRALSAISGIIGMTPSSLGSITGNPSLFESLVREKALQRNMFSMRLQEPMEILFGGVNHSLFTDELIQIPLTNNTGDHALTGRWQAQVSYLTLGRDSEPGIQMPLSGYTASFGTKSVFIGLPRRLVEAIHQHLNFENYLNVAMRINCALRDSMPNLTLILGGKNFTLTPYEYTHEWMVPDDDEIHCQSALQPFGRDSKEIVLGTAFLRVFYSVFDLDTRTVGCKSSVVCLCRSLSCCLADFMQLLLYHDNLECGHEQTKLSALRFSRY